MKELSIEKKAKAYDSMFERLKEMYNNNKTNVAARLIYERYFPELKESEDEMIRKGLIEACKQSLIVGGFHKDKVIAWLEKQGEYAKFRNKIQIGDKVTRNKDGVLVNLSQLKRVAKHAEEQGEQILANSAKTCKDEQKPVSWLEEFGFEQNGYDPVHVLKTIKEKWPMAWEKVLYQEQKPVEPQQDMLSQEQYAKAVDECIYGEQKLVEWSEEDEEIKKELSNHCLNAAIGHTMVVSTDDYAKWYNWLKSLRPQSLWKPSDEQIDALEDAIADAVSSIQKNMLNSLYSDLKKL